MNRRGFIGALGAGIAVAICGPAGRCAGVQRNSVMFLGYDVSRLAATPGEVVKAVNTLLVATYDKVGVFCANGFSTGLMSEKKDANFTIPNGVATWTELQYRLTKLENHIRSSFAVDEKNQAVYAYLARNVGDIYAAEKVMRRSEVSA